MPALPGKAKEENLNALAGVAVPQNEVMKVVVDMGWLLVAQSNHGINTGGAAGGDVAGG